MFWCARNLVRSGSAASSKQLLQQQLGGALFTNSGSVRSYASKSDDSNADSKDKNDKDSANANVDQSNPNPTSPGGSTVDIKKLLQQFDQKFQPGSVNKAAAAAAAGLAGDKNGAQTNFNLDELDENEEDDEDVDPDIDEGKALFDRALAEEYEITPYLFDPKMIKEYNRYQEKAVPADFIDLQEDMNNIEILAENEPMDRELMQMLREEMDQKLAGRETDDVEDYDEAAELAAANAQQNQHPEDAEEMDENEEDDDQLDLENGEELDETTDNTDLFEWMDSVKFDEKDMSHVRQLREKMGEERVSELEDLREYMREVGHDASRYNLRDMLEIMELDEASLVDLVEDDFERYEVERFDLDDELTLDQIPKYRVDEEGNEIEGEISDAYVKFGRDYYELGVDTPLDAEEMKDIAQGDAQRAEAARLAAETGQSNTLYDDENVGEDYFLDEDQEYDEKEIEEVSKMLDKEPIFEYEISDAQEQLMDTGMLDDIQASLKEEVEFENRAYELVAKKLGLTDLPKGVTTASLRQMNDEQFKSILRQTNLEQFVGLSEEECDRIADKAVNEVQLELKKENEKKTLSSGKSKATAADEVDEDEYDEDIDEDNEEELLDTTANFEIDEETKEINIHNTQGLVELNDLAEEIVMNDEVYNTSYKDDLKVLGLEADMYLRRNEKKMKVLAKRRERAAKYREATLAKNRENPAPPKPYQRQAIPEGDNIYTTPMAPNTFIRINEFTEEEGAEHKNLYKNILGESNRTFAANGYYSHHSAKQSMTYIRQALASYKPHLKSRRQQLEDATIVKDPRFEKNKAIIIEPWQLPRYNPEYYSYDDRK